jgi:hypothetical protein
MITDHRAVSDAELITHLRRAASTWFRNTDLHALEELIRRYHGRRVAPAKPADRNARTPASEP